MRKIWIFVVAGLLLVAPGFAAAGEAEYKKAYKELESRDDGTMLVMITTDWCPGCIKVKPLAKEHGVIDLDPDTVMGSRIIHGTSIPQLHVFEKKNGRWKRTILVGAHEIIPFLEER